MMKTQDGVEIVPGMAAFFQSANGRTMKLGVTVNWAAEDRIFFMDGGVEYEWPIEQVFASSQALMNALGMVNKC